MAEVKTVDGIHRAHTWEIGMYALNNTSTNTYMVAYMYISYYLTGPVGLGVVLVGTISTLMRMWDGITDPFIGFVVDRTDGKFGKNRPFIVIGNVILCVTSFIIYKFCHVIPQAARLPFYVAMYMLYIIGYTCQCVVTKSAQTCLTNDPKQRPVFAMFDSVYNTVLFAIMPIVVSKVFMPKYNTYGPDGKVTVSALSNPDFFMALWALCAGLSAVFAICGIIGLWRKDRTEYFGTGEAHMVTFKDYWEVLKSNRAIQMLVVSASSDKLCTGMMQNPVILVIIYGILCGNYEDVNAYVSGITTIPVVLLTLLGMNFIARRMGQKKALLFGTYGAMACATALFLLFLWGDPAEFGLNLYGFFGIAFIVLFILEKAFVNISGSIVIPMTADCADYEVYRSGKYVPGLMGTLFSFVDKIISALGSTIVALMLAAIGFKDVQPDPTTPYSTALFWVAMACFVGAPMFGWLCNIISMKFYPLTKEKMEEIQEEIARIKAEAAAKKG